jgi:hypothetical protein
MRFGFKALIPGALVLLATGCSTLQVATDFDPSVNFAAYRTFALKDGAKAKNSIAQVRITKAIVETLEARGLKRVTGDADVKVYAHFVLGRDVRLYSYGYGMGGWYGGRWGGWGGGYGATDVQQIPTGTIVVDLVDGKENRLVWRGTAKDRISRDDTPEERAVKAKEAAGKLFEGFPPKPSTAPNPKA